MSRTYLVVYEEVGDTGDYPSLCNALRKMPSYWNYMTYVWAISTDNSVEGVFSSVAPYIDKNDHLMIVEIHPDALYQGWLPTEAWKSFKKLRTPGLESVHAEEGKEDKKEESEEESKREEFIKKILKDPIPVEIKAKEPVLEPEPSKDADEVLTCAFCSQSAKRSEWNGSQCSRCGIERK